MSHIERQLAAAARRHKAHAQRLEQAEGERDELIREAIKADIPRARIAELAGLSEHRIYQIRRGSRI